MNQRHTRAPRSLVAALILAILTATGLVVAQGSASAASNLSEQVDHTYQTNGRVAAILPIGNTLYLAGSFTSLRPYGDDPGTGEVARNYLAAIDRDTGQLLPWNPNANKEAYALAASPDGSTIYIGGLFTAVGGANRQKAAAVTASTGAVTAWAPTFDNKVLALAVSGSRIFVGGNFTTASGQARAGLAVVSPTGAVDPGWHPAPDDRVLTLAVSTDGASVYAGGDFLSVNGDTRQKHLASLSAASGALQSWNFHPGYPVYALAVTATALYVGGNGSGGHASAYSLPAGSQLWDDQTDGGAQGIAVIGDTVYVGGHFDNFCTSPIVGTTIECPTVLAVRHKILALDAATGALDPWDPGADSPLGVFAVATSAGRLEIGGDFERSGHFRKQQGFAQFSIPGSTVFPTGDAFTPVVPRRILDTRSGLGLVGGPAKVGPGKSLVVHVGGVAGVPLGIDAVVLNVTAVAPSATTYISAYPGDLTSPPTASNLNVTRGQIVPGLVTVKVDGAGTVRLFNAAGTVDLLADVAGYYSATGADSYTPLAPTRVLDTRAGLGAPTAPLAAGGTVDLQVTGTAGIPADAVAVVMNVTATGASASTYVQVYPTPAGAGAPPTVSNLNVSSGRTVANMVTVLIGSSGQVRLGNAFGHVDVVADVAGYFSTSTAGSRYTPVTPNRLLDTRSGLGQPSGQIGRAGPGGLIDLQVTGVDGVPVDATAAIVNLTAVLPSGSTYEQAYPTPTGGTAFPTVSTVNPPAGTIVANLTAVTLGAGGSIRLRNHVGTTDLIADLAGYYSSLAGVNHGSGPAAPSVRGVTLAASVSTPNPPQGGTELVQVTTLPGATVSATAGFRTGPVTQTGTANGSGVVTLSFPVGTAAIGVPVTVSVTATSDALGSLATTSTGFTPA